MLNNSVSLVVQGLHSICPWFSGSGSNQALNGFQHWLPAASNTIAKTLWAPSALTVLGLWSKQCNERQDYKEHNDHKRPRETKLWQTRLFRSLWFLNHPDWLKRWGWRKDNPVFLSLQWLEWLFDCTFTFFCSGRNPDFCRTVHQAFHLFQDKPQPVRPKPRSKNSRLAQKLCKQWWQLRSLKKKQWTYHWMMSCSLCVVYSFNVIQTTQQHLRHSCFC